MSLAPIRHEKRYFEWVHETPNCLRHEIRESCIMGGGHYVFAAVAVTADGRVTGLFLTEDDKPPHSATWDPPVSIDDINPDWMREQVRFATEAKGRT